MSSLLSQFINRPTLIAPGRFQHLVATALPAKTAGIPDFSDPENWFAKTVAQEYRVENGVAIVPINGVICRGMSAVECAFYGLADADKVFSDIQRAGLDPSASVIRLDINSPGGAVPLVAEIAALVATISEKKMVIARVDELCASAAMWIAAGSSSIVATIGAEVGSVGVFLQVWDYSEMLKEMGIKVETFTSGDFKGIGAVGTSLTDKQKDYLQKSVMETDADFKAFIRAQRGAVDDDTMQGQTFSAKDAVAVNLVDEILPNASEIDALCVMAAARLIAKR